MADEQHDPLSFLEKGSMSEAERDALRVTAGGQSPTTETQVVEQPAGNVAAPAQAEPAKVVEKFEDDGTGHQVPLTALLNEREKRQKAEEALAARTKADQETTNREPLTFELPDPKADPAAYAQAQANVAQLSILNERMNFSEKFARKEHTNAVVDAASEWATARFKADPSYEERIIHEADPYETIVRDFKAQQRIKEVETDDEWAKYQEWRKANGLSVQGDTGQQLAPTQQQPAAAAQPAATPQPTAPRMPSSSIADMPGAGGGQTTVPVGPGQAFDAVIK